MNTTATTFGDISYLMAFFYRIIIEHQIDTDSNFFCHVENYNNGAFCDQKSKFSHFEVFRIIIIVVKFYFSNLIQ